MSVFLRLGSTAKLKKEISDLLRNNRNLTNQKPWTRAQSAQNCLWRFSLRRILRY